MSLKASRIGVGLTKLSEIPKRLVQWLLRQTIQRAWKQAQQLRKSRQFQLLFLLAAVLLLIAVIFWLVKAYVNPGTTAERKDVVDLAVKALSALSVITGAFFALQQLVINREGQYTDRFTKAISQLGDERLEIKLGGIYALERIARDSKKDHWAVMETLTAYVRENASFNLRKTKSNLISDYVLGGSLRQEEPLHPNTDIQTILTVIGRRTQIQRNSEEDSLNLPFVDIRGALLWGAHLERAILWRVHLEEAVLGKAHLENAMLKEAHLEGTHLEGAYLKEANLEDAHLEKAFLPEAHLEKAYLMKAHLEQAQMPGAYLKEAFLQRTNMEGSNLQMANLTKANLMEAHLVKADLTGANLRKAWLKDADLRWAQMEGADLQGANLQGANLSGASLTEGQLRDSMLCNTILPNGTVSKRDCRKLNS